jgi:sporulation protein YlmC with PRC-barrel domain
MKKCAISSKLVAAALCVASAAGTVSVAQTVTSTPNQTVINQSDPNATTTTTTTTTTTPAGTTATPPETISKCSQLIGTKVINEQGKDLGRITDVVVSFNNNQVSYCVMRVNRHGLFARTKYIAVPLAAFQPGINGAYVTLNADPANLAQAQGFSRDQWPSEVNTAWGAEPAAPVELPPAVVYAPVPTPPGHEPNTQSWVADGVEATPILGFSAATATDASEFQMQFGEALMKH